MAVSLWPDSFTLQRLIGASLAIGGVAVVLWGIWPDLKRRRRRHAPTVPAARTRLSPLEDPGWWRLEVLARNLNRTPVEIDSLELSRRSNAWLAPYRTKSVDGGEFSGSFPPIVDATKLVKLLPFHIALAPAGSKPTTIGNFGFIARGSSSADIGQCLLFLPASRSRRKLTVRMQYVCKTSVERRMSTKLKIMAPPSAAAAAVEHDTGQTVIADLQPSRQEADRAATDII